MFCRFSPSLVVIATILLAQCGIKSLCAAEAEINAKLSEDGKKVTVTVDGELFAEYLTCSGTKPIIWPIISTPRHRKPWPIWSGRGSSPIGFC